MMKFQPLDQVLLPSDSVFQGENTQPCTFYTLCTAPEHNSRGCHLHRPRGECYRPPSFVQLLPVSRIPAVSKRAESVPFQSSTAQGQKSKLWWWEESEVRREVSAYLRPPRLPHSSISSDLLWERIVSGHIQIAHMDRGHEDKQNRENGLKSSVTLWWVPL